MSCKRPQICGYRTDCAYIGGRICCTGLGDRGRGFVAAAVVAALIFPDAVVRAVILPAVIGVVR